MKAAFDKGGLIAPFKVAVLLASYNGEKYIKAQIDSILNQNACEINIIVSDDHSTDATLEILKVLADNNPGKISWVLTETRRGSAGGNFYELIDKNNLASYDFVAFSDQDDIWQKDHLASSIEICLSNACDGVSSNVLALLPDGTLKMYRKNQPLKQYDFFFESPGPGCTFVVTRNLFSYIRGVVQNYRKTIDHVFHHDWLIYAIARSAGFRWCIRDQPLIHYRQHGNNETGARIGLKGLYVRYKKMRSGWYADQIHNVAFVVRLTGVMKADPVLSCLVDRKNRFLLLKWCNQTRRCFTDRFVFTLAVLIGLIKLVDVVNKGIKESENQRAGN